MVSIWYLPFVYNRELIAVILMQSISWMGTFFSQSLEHEPRFACPYIHVSVIVMTTPVYNNHRESQPFTCDGDMRATLIYFPPYTHISKHIIAPFSAHMLLTKLHTLRALPPRVHKRFTITTCRARASRAPQCELYLHHDMLCVCAENCDVCLLYCECVRKGSRHLR